MSLKGYKYKSNVIFHVEMTYELSTGKHAYTQPQFATSPQQAIGLARSTMSYKNHPTFKAEIIKFEENPSGKVTECRGWTLPVIAIMSNTL